MKKRFIVLIDFTEYSGNLLRYAYDWSKQAQAELLLVHRTEAMAPALADNLSRRQIADYANAEALSRLKALAGELILPSAEVNLLVSEKPVTYTLKRLLAESYDDVIFTGLKGTGVFKKIFIGSVALSVIEKVNAIVVAVPKEVSQYSHRRIYVAVSRVYPLNVFELNKLFELIDADTTSVTFFNLAVPGEQDPSIEKYLKELVMLYSDRYDTSYSIYEGIDALQDIKKVVNNKVDEILVIQRGSRLLTDHVLRRFLINELVYEGQTPMIVLT